MGTCRQSAVILHRDEAPAIVLSATQPDGSILVRLDNQGPIGVLAKDRRRFPVNALECSAELEVPQGSPLCDVLGAC